MPGEVFISYSRRDKDFVRRLHDALKAAGRDAWVDWEDIPLTADWWLEVCAGIEAADSFVFVISPDSVRSATCFREIDYATQHNKRMVPLLRRELTDESDTQRLHPSVNAHNWIFFRDQDDFNTAFKALIDALDTDLSYVREHTRLLVRARSWENRQRDRSLLLTGTELVAAEAWLREGLRMTRYAPSDLHVDFIRESRRAQNRRQRRTQVISGVVALILLLLVASLVQYFRAEDARREAARSAEAAERQGQISEAIGLAAQAQLELFGPFPERGVLLALEALENYPYVWQADRALGAAVQTSRARQVFDSGALDVPDAAFSPDGSVVAVASNNIADRVYTAQLWDLEGSEPYLTMIGHTEALTSVAWSPDGQYLITGSRDRTARLWLTTTGDPLATLSSHSDWVLDVAWSPDGRWIVTTGADNTALVWDAQQVIADALVVQTQLAQSINVPVLTLSGHEDWVTSADWSPDSTRLVTGSRDETVRVWDAVTGEELLNIGLGDQVTGVAFSPDGSLLLVTYNDADFLVFGAAVWNAATGELVSMLHGHTNTVTGGTWSPDGTWVVTTSLDRSIRLWLYATSGSTEFVASGHNGGVNSVDWSSDMLLLTGGTDGTARLWDARQGDERLALLHGGKVMGAAWDASGSRLLTWSADRNVRVWDVASAVELLTLAHDGSVSGAQWSHDETQILSWSVDRTARVWDVASGSEVLRIQTNRPITAAAWSPDETRIVTSANSREAIIWDAATRVELLRLTVDDDTDLIRSITYSADGTRILTTHSTGDPVARLWEASTGALLLTLTGHTGGVNSAAWSPDGARIATASDDDTIRVWDAVSGAPLLVIAGHTDDVMTATWSPDGSRILSASLDRTARVWNSATGSELQDITGHLGGLNGADWSPDGQFSVTASRDNWAMVWDTWQKTSDLIAFARGCCVVRDLTPEERSQFELSAE